MKRGFEIGRSFMRLLVTQQAVNAVSIPETVVRYDCFLDPSATILLST
jgi:hypothetical protein